MSTYVIGMGFGDEGKGSIVSKILYDGSEIGFHEYPKVNVIRYCGGPQAAHNVMSRGGFQHVFSHFGSGTSMGSMTMWRCGCLFNPETFLIELEILNKKKIKPRILIDPDCEVVTIFDTDHNQCNMKGRRNSTGHGINSTWNRVGANYHLKVRDLIDPVLLESKLEAIADYYSVINKGMTNSTRSYDVGHMINIAKKFKLELNDDIKVAPCGHYDGVYESAQGLLLDPEYGVFPYVTRKGVLPVDLNSESKYHRFYMVIRAMHTRHGDGPLPGLEHKITHLKNPYEQNNENIFQGRFREAPLNLDLLRYSVGCMETWFVNRQSCGQEFNKILVVTCVDLLPEMPQMLVNGKIKQFTSAALFLDEIRNVLPSDWSVGYTDSPYYEDPIKPFPGVKK